jgi:hypothetical protein
MQTITGQLVKVTLEVTQPGSPVMWLELARRAGAFMVGDLSALRLRGQAAGVEDVLRFLATARPGMFVVTLQIDNHAYDRVRQAGFDELPAAR